MVKGKAAKRAHEEVDTYEEDDFVENDDGAARKSKKTKKAAQSSSEDAEKFWELSNGRNSRRVTVQDFKGQKLINIREYYEKDGEYKPSSKGISLTVDQYKLLLGALPKVNTHLKGMGIDVSGSEVPDEQSEEEKVPTKRIKPVKQEKANIEATSDEEEE